MLSPGYLTTTASPSGLQGPSFVPQQPELAPELTFTGSSSQPGQPLPGQPAQSPAMASSFASAGGTLDISFSPRGYTTVTAAPGVPLAQQPQQPAQAPPSPGTAEVSITAVPAAGSSSLQITIATPVSCQAPPSWGLGGRHAPLLPLPCCSRPTAPESPLPG